MAAGVSEAQNVLPDSAHLCRWSRWLQWLQWLHSAFVRVRSGSLALREDAGNDRFRRTRAHGHARPPPFAMQKVVGSSPIIRFNDKPGGCGAFVFSH
jgi:hypothetical protein